jgi:hypothetical protein
MQVRIVSHAWPPGSGGSEEADASLYDALKANRPVRFIEGIDL